MSIRKLSRLLDATIVWFKQDGRPTTAWYDYERDRDAAIRKIIDETTPVTVANLPANATAGDRAFASNGRKVGEGGGAGTGVPVYYDGTAWRAVATDTTVAA